MQGRFSYLLNVQGNREVTIITRVLITMPWAINTAIVTLEKNTTWKISHDTIKIERSIALIGLYSEGKVIASINSSCHRITSQQWRVNGELTSIVGLSFQLLND